MSNSVYDHLENVLSEGTDFHITEYINRGFELWQKYAGGFILFAVIFALSSGLLQMIPLIGDLANGLWFEPALALGGAIASHRIFYNKEKSAGNFLKGFEYSIQIIIARVILAGIIFILMIPFFYLLGIGVVSSLFEGQFMIQGLIEAGFRFWMMIFLIPLIYVFVLFAYVDQFICFYDLPATDAIKYSVRFVHRHWISVFLFFVLIILIVAVGLVGLIIGVFVTLSMVFPMSFYSFQDFTRLSEYQSAGPVSENYQV